MVNIYPVSADVLAKVGPGPAVIHAVLLTHDTGSGVELTNKNIAKLANVSEKTARRFLSILREVGLLKTEAVFEDNWQQANRQQIPTSSGHSHSAQTLGQFDHPNTYLDIEEVDMEVDLQEEVLEEYLEEELPAETLHQGGQGGGLRPPLADNQSRPADVSSREAEVVRKFPEIPETPFDPGAQVPRHGRSLLAIHRQALWIVGYFEKYAKTTASQKITDKKRCSWLDAAFDLVSSKRPHSEICAQIHWLFTECDGRFPFRPAYPERKITNLKQIAVNYDRTQEAMATGVHSAEPPHIAYGSPLEDRDLEKQVSELVRLFTDYRLAMGEEEIHHTRTWRWAKSFRIMLVHRQTPFEDLKTVVIGLKEFCSELDVGRYPDAYDLQDSGTFRHILDDVKLEQLKADGDTGEPQSGYLVGVDTPTAQEAALLQNLAEELGDAPATTNPKTSSAKAESNKRTDRRLRSGAT